MGRHSTKNNQLKKQIAEIAARIMNESGLRDYQMAKQKAASGLGIQERKNWPSNQEIEQALADYQRLFGGGSQQEHIKHLRQIAISAMQFLVQFEPRLVGSVLHGNIKQFTEVEIHLFSDSSELVGLYLEENKVPFEEKDKRFRFVSDDYQRFPVFKFIADDIAIELTVFPYDGLRQAPLSSVNAKPMQRASVLEVQEK